MQFGPRYAGYGYAVAWDGAVQMVPDNEKTYHVGAHHYFPWIIEKYGEDPGSSLIGVLMSHRGSEYGEYDHKTLHDGVELLAGLSLYYGWAVRDDVMQHSQVTGKGLMGEEGPADALPCPRYFVSNPIAWWQFVKSVEARTIQLRIEQEDRES